MKSKEITNNSTKTDLHWINSKATKADTRQLII